MITLNDLLTIADAKQMRVIVPVTLRLRARISVNPRQTDELNDLIALYGEMPVFSAEPVEGGNILEIVMQQPALQDMDRLKQDLK